MLGSVLGNPGILSRHVRWNFPSNLFPFLDVFAIPEGIEIRAGAESEVLALYQRLSKKNWIFRNADMCPNVSVPNPVLDRGLLVTGRNVFTTIPTLLDMRRCDRKHVALPHAGRETHPGVRCIRRGMRPSVHPNHPVLFISADRLVDRDELVGDGVSFFPDPCPKRPAVNVGHHMHLALMLLERQSRRLIRQPPLSSLIVYGESEKLYQRRPCSAFRTILRVRIAVPDPGEIDLSECRDAEKQHHSQERRNHNPGSIYITHAILPIGSDVY